MDNNIQVIRQAHKGDLKSLQQFLIENKLRPSIVINENSLYYYTQIDGKMIGPLVPNSISIMRSLERLE